MGASDPRKWPHTLSLMTRHALHALHTHCINTNDKHDHAWQFGSMHEYARDLVERGSRN